MLTIPIRTKFALAILTIAAIPAGATFAAEGGHGGHEHGGFDGAASTNRGAGQTVFSSHGPVVTTGGAGSFQTTTTPSGGGGQGLLMNNGNGTSTLTGPRGVVTTVPSPQ
jgi:hypothetical protein